MTWAEDIDDLQHCALSLGFLGWALVRTAPEITELDDFAGEATRGAGRAVIALSHGLGRLVRDLAGELAAGRHNDTPRKDT